MENKINIAELLKDCPRGTKLYSPLCGECTLYDVNDYNIRISTPNKDTLICLYHDGRYCSNGKIMLFPKGKTTWEGFQRPFKDGDIIVTKTFNNFIFYSIYKGVENREVLTYVDYTPDDNRLINVNHTLCYSCEIIEQRLATEEEKEKLFNAIKTNGYKWNEDTKTLEKLPKFKVRDRIEYINGKNKNGVKEGIILSITNDTYDVAVTNDMGIFVPISEQDEWELVPNKFDITTLKPFDNCKYSLDNGRTWKFAQYWYIMDNYKIDDIKIELWQD